MHRARLCAALLAIASTTLAVDPPAHAQRSSKTDRERANKARDAYDDGKKAYNLGDFERAIDLWKQGYEYKDDPIFLFNIAQAYRQKGDYQKALFFYRSYLREDPKARNRDDVDARIAELQKLANQPEPRPPVIAPEPPPTAVPEPRVPVAAEPRPVFTPVRDEAPDHPGRGMKIGGIVTGGVGLAATVTGIVFLLRSSSIEGELEDAAATGEPWTQELIDKEASGRSAQTIGFVAIGVGLACAIGGGTLFAMGARKDAAARQELQGRWEVVPVRHLAGGGVLLKLSF